MPIRKRQQGRTKQKQRTRRLILAAAAALIASGKRPSVTAAADEAQVSRRTAYRYFPSQEKLLAEAALEGVRPAMQAELAAAPSGDSDVEIESRVIALVRSMQKLTLQNESLLRTMVHSTVLDKGPISPKRGTRRIEWIESAVDPLRTRLKPAAYERLVSGLALCTGIEAMLVFRDIRGLTDAQAIKASEAFALTLVQAALQEASRER